MSSPVIETIISDVVAAVDGISVQAGYNSTISYADRFHRYLAEGAKRPSCVVRYLGESLSRSSVTERRVNAGVEILAKLEYDKFSANGSDKQTALLGFDIASALTHIDYSTKSYDLDSIDIRPLIEEDSEDPVDGVRIVLSFSYQVDHEDIHTATEP